MLIIFSIFINLMSKRCNFSINLMAVIFKFPNYVVSIIFDLSDNTTNIIRRDKRPIITQKRMSYVNKEQWKLSKEQYN